MIAWKDKHETRSTKSETKNKHEIQRLARNLWMAEGERAPRFDLEDRTFRFAQAVRAWVKQLPRTICNIEDVKQVVRSSGSPGANYIEANEAQSKKDFRFRIKTCRKESKESAYWLRLLDTGDNKALETERQRLVTESYELMRIFAAILRNSE